jgi:hypothetical protein
MDLQGEKAVSPWFVVAAQLHRDFIAGLDRRSVPPRDRSLRAARSSAATPQQRPIRTVDVMSEQPLRDVLGALGPLTRYVSSTTGSTSETGFDLVFPHRRALFPADDAAHRCGRATAAVCCCSRCRQL